MSRKHIFSLFIYILEYEFRSLAGVFVSLKVYSKKHVYEEDRECAFAHVLNKRKFPTHKSNDDEPLQKSSREIHAVGHCEHVHSC